MCRGVSSSTPSWLSSWGLTMLSMGTNWVTMKRAFCLSITREGATWLEGRAGFTANHSYVQNRRPFVHYSCLWSLKSVCLHLFTRPAWLRRHVGCSLYLGGQECPQGLPARNIEIDLFSSADNQPTLLATALWICYLVFTHGNTKIYQIEEDGAWKLFDLGTWEWNVIGNTQFFFLA